MPKNILMDVIPPKKIIRNIQLSEIKLSEIRKKDTRPNPPKEIEQTERKKKKGGSKFRMCFFGLIILVVVIFIALSINASATLNITLKQEKKSVRIALLASKLGKTDGIPFEIIKISKEQKTEVPAIAKKNVVEKASGKIIIYNKYSKDSQQLVKNTKFKSSGGLIFKLKNSVVVPGRQSKNGEIIPGSVEAVINAEFDGEKYNIGLADFTIPLFANTKKHDGFYARSKTPIEGGYTGQINVADSKIIDIAKTNLRKALKSSLINEAYFGKSENFILLNNANVISYDSSQTKSSEHLVEISERATIYGILLKESDFINVITKKTFTNYDSGSVKIKDIKELEFISPDNTGDLLEAGGNFWEADEFQFNIKGNIKFEWRFDAEKLKAELAGSSRKNMDKILANFLGIQQVEIYIRPFWKFSFPKNINKIHIKILGDK